MDFFFTRKVAHRGAKWTLDSLAPTNTILRLSVSDSNLKKLFSWNAEYFMSVSLLRHYTGNLTMANERHETNLATVANLDAVANLAAIGWIKLG